MAPRLDLQVTLEDILGSDRVYAQPPANVQLQYPCIIYQRDGASTEFADNVPYSFEQRYQITLITRQLDDVTLKKLTRLPKCLYVRYFPANNLHHDVFTMYY